MNDNFLLKSDLALNLFNKASQLPIIDYHCHLSPKEIYEDKPFENITQIWLYGDHYKWRLMRACGIDEEYITGKASDLDKFKAYAKTLELSIGNPVYTFSHLELQRYFDIFEPLTVLNAEEIYNRCNTVIKERKYSPRKLITISNVETLCTTDDPIDSLEYHRLLKEDDSFKTGVYPAFRPDKAKDINNHHYYQYIDSLSKTADIEINSFDSLITALHKRIEYFNSLGCHTSDHALITVPYTIVSKDELDEIFNRALTNQELTDKEISAFETAFMLKMAEFDNEFNWVMQLHFGCIRNNNSRMFKLLGPDTGYDAINEKGVGSLGSFLNHLDQENHLPKTVLYSLNPNENAQIVTMMGCF
ncbi:MAG: glucuronate isomerase, partial [Erysipelotrichaceae bacterium]